MPGWCVICARLGDQTGGVCGQDVVDGCGLVFLVENRWESGVEAVRYERSKSVGETDFLCPVGDAGVTTSRAVSRILPVRIPVASDDAGVERVFHSAV